MKNYRQEGKQITGTAPYAVSSGGGCQIGIVFGCALADAANGAEVTLLREGQNVLPKATGAAWVQWTTKLYWDNAAKNVTTTASTNIFIGVPAQAAASGDATGEVLLHGQIA